MLTLHGDPLPAVRVTALPFDLDGLLDSLAEAAPFPRPSFPDLEREMLAYRPASLEDLGPAGRAWAATRDSVQRLADSLRSVGHEAPGYPAAYRRFQALYRRLTERAARRDALLRDLTDTVRSLAERAGEAADSLRAWEDVAYQAVDSLVAERLTTLGRHSVEGLTGPDGRIRLRLAPGAWWLRADTPHPENPFLEYEWSVPVWVRGWWPVRTRLNLCGARLAWRH